ncbi:Hypothetical protein D9617_17g047020 [Elsinoe fawcettii]|nr:Hypothetical protein D9617_17g047020 [Elsinoe fawcettii]
MKFIIIALLALTASPAFANVAEKRSVVDGPCTIQPGGLSGVCVTTSKCSAAGGTSLIGFCPGTPNNVRCCFKADCSGSSSACLWTSQGCKNGSFKKNLCPGPAAFQCCVQN